MAGTYALVTGGAGFVGSNLADRLLAEGRSVVLFDWLGRPGVEQNVVWLADRHGDRVRLANADVRDVAMVRDAVAGADQVFHLAAQVALTTSHDDPWSDFTINTAGTVALLQALRALPRSPPLVFASTSQVYGDLAELPLVVRAGRWEPLDEELAWTGISEGRPLAFRSPHGCSKGAADQYVLDHAQTYGIPACVFRMSAVYGPRQLGSDDRGWLAHFLARSRAGRPIPLHGDGRQVRDALYVDDLVDALLVARDRMDALAGRAYNVGGGPHNAASLLEWVERIGALHGRPPEIEHGPWRRADPRWYVSDTRAFSSASGWRARVGLDEGLARLDRWLGEPR